MIAEASALAEIFLWVAAKFDVKFVKTPDTTYPSCCLRPSRGRQTSFFKGNLREKLRKKLKIIKKTLAQPAKHRVASMRRTAASLLRAATRSVRFVVCQRVFALSLVLAEHFTILRPASPALQRVGVLRRRSAVDAGCGAAGRAPRGCADPPHRAGARSRGHRRAHAVQSGGAAGQVYRRAGAGEGVRRRWRHALTRPAPLRLLQERRQARRRGGAAQPVAAAQSGQPAEGGQCVWLRSSSPVPSPQRAPSCAEEHPHDWAHRMREDGDCAPAGEARGCALHQGEPRRLPPFLPFFLTHCGSPGGGDQVHGGGLPRS